MNCPICNSFMLLSKKHGIEEKYCPQCNEIWPSKRKNTKSDPIISSSHHSNTGYNQHYHVYNKTNNHEFMDDKKRYKELLFLLE